VVRAQWLIGQRQVGATLVQQHLALPRSAMGRTGQYMFQGVVDQLVAAGKLDAAEQLLLRDIAARPAAAGMSFSFLAQVRIRQRRYGAALEALDLARASSWDDTVTRPRLALLMGDPQALRAIDTLALKSVGAMGGHATLAMMEFSFAEAAQAQARPHLVEYHALRSDQCLRKFSPVGDRARVLAWRGQNDLLFAHLDKALQQLRPSTCVDSLNELLLLQDCPFMDKVRNDPRWPVFVAKVGGQAADLRDIVFDLPPQQAAAKVSPEGDASTASPAH
jgi:hypothetical protein